MLQTFENKTIIAKQVLREHLEVSRATFNRWMIEICKNKNCPFTYEEIKKKHFFNKKELTYILANI